MLAAGKKTVEDAKTPSLPKGAGSLQRGHWTMCDGSPPNRDQPAPGPSGPPSVQAPPRLTLSSILRPPEQGLASTVLLKALPIPLYHMVPPGAPQPRAAPAPSSLDGASVPLILSPLLQPEGPPGPAQVGKPPAPMLAVSLVGAVPLLSPGLGTPLSSPGRARSSGRYLCPHCARDCLKPSVLEKHIRSHTGERPFPCATCGIAFKTQSNLYKHRRTQTHRSNAGRCSQSDGGLPDDGDSAGETPGADGRSGAGASEGPLGPLDTEVVSFVDGAPPRTLPEKSPTASKPCPLRRQQAASWDSKSPEARLRKCESSDSGYLSRSDSAEQTPASPLHGPSEGEGGLGPGGRNAPLELEKRRLEERISRLISLNQAVVDDTQLDTVRPRKTVLSKQGSIDLPLPYTYKDSFHFDMRPPEQARRRQAPLGPAHSTCAPPDKARPLSFHSVPTQLSTVECLSVTRSNSLPFVETTRTWRECGPALPAARGPRPLSPKPGLARLGPFLLAAPSSHPRALVRQGAVEDLPATPSGENSGPPADPQRTTAGQGPAGRGRTFGKRGSRRLKMFSQDKWQMYGDETFKRIYQKSRAGPQEGSKATEVSTEPLLQMETTQRGDTRTPMCEDMSTPTCGDTRTPLCGDTSTPVCEDTSTSKCGDTRTPVCGDMSTPTCGDMRTPLCGDTSTPVCEDTSTSKCGDTRTPVCGDMSTPTCGDTRTCICGVTSTPMCGDMRTSVCGDMSTPVCGDISTSVCDNVKTSLCKYTLPPTAVSSGAEPGSKGGCMSPKPSVMAEPPKTRSGGSGEPKASIAVTPLTLICEDTPSLGWESPQLPPSVGQAPGAEVSLGLSAPKGRDHGGPKQDTVSDSDRGEIEACLWAQGTLRLPSDGLEHSLAMTDRLPLDRKKLRVEGLRDPPHGWLDSLGVGGERAEPPEVPVQPLSQLAWDIAPAGKPGALSLGADLVREGQNTSLGSTGSSLAPLDILRQREARGKESPMTPAAVPHGPYPQAPDNVFTPKYLLRLPHGENPSKLPAKRGHGQDQNAFCRREWPAESSSVVSGVGIALGPGPALVRIQGDTDGIPRDPDSPRTQDGVQRMQVGKEGEDRPDLSLLGTQDPAPIPPTLAPGSCLSQDMGFKVPATQRLCSSNMSMRTRPSGGAPHPWPPTWEKSPGDLHPRSWVQLRSHHSFLSAIARPLAWTEPAVPPPSGKPRTCEADSPFPTLGAEPQLTWCCLSPSLSLPAEQKKTTSVYSSLHPLGGDPEDQGLEGWIVTSQRHSGPGQLSKLSSVVPGTVSRAPVPKRRRPRRSTRTSRGSGRQKKLRINPKRYRGAFLQSRVQRRISRQHKPHWILSRTCHPHPHERQDPCKTLQWASPDAAGLNPQAEPSGTSSDPSLCFWDKEEKVEDDRGISATLAPRTSPRNVQEMQMAVKDISPPAGEGSNCSPQSPAAEARSTLQSHSCPVVGKDCVPPCGEDLNVGLLETQPLLPSEEVSVDTKLGIFADSQELSSFESKGAFPCHDVATSVAVICTSPGSRVSHTTLGVPSAEPPSHSWDVEETEARSLSDRKAIVEDSSLPPSPGEPLSGPFPLESTEKTLSEIPASGSSLDNSGQAEGRQEAVFPSRSQYECGEEVTPCHPLESGNKKGQVVESITLRDCVGPASPGKPAGILGDSSKTIKKRGLGGMRKQTRVDFSDTSSDDEDRLVIEI